jgi:FkbM family methyltransferase
LRYFISAEGILGYHAITEKEMLMQIFKKAINRTFLSTPIHWLLAMRDRRLKKTERFLDMDKLRQWTTHDQEIFDLYSTFVSKGALCFDVGANIGNRIKIFIKLQADIVAVEPQAECVRVLRKVYGINRNLTIVQKALGESEGKAEIMISNSNTISSLSPEWIDSVRKSGRFTKYRWDEKQVISMTTLDKLIKKYGVPSFIKIDVEGFEYQVVKGLSQPVKALSFEFTPEFIESSFKCIDHLQRLGDILLNYSVGETMQLESKEWVTPQEMVRILSSFRGNNRLFGDVYVKFLG